jgi:LPS-assembly protein
MSILKMPFILLSCLLLLCLTPSIATTADTANALCLGALSTPVPSLRASAIAKALGWIETGENLCGGYYLEPSFIGTHTLLKTNHIQLSSNQGIVFSLHGMSIAEGKITITQDGQQIIANKAYLYRDPATGKLNAIDLIGHVVLRQPNALILARRGYINLKMKQKSLQHILYRNAIYSKASINQPLAPSNEQIQHQHKVYQLSAWGKAEKFKQNDPHISIFEQASYSTCPPLTNVWQIKASHLELNKYSGRGVARHARLLIKGIPVLYTPYLNFPIDSRRETGFLPPILRPYTRQSGAILAAPFYWNLAPNYDDTITPAILAKRGWQLTNLFRYLTPKSVGEIKIAALPGDRLFNIFKQHEIKTYQTASDSPTQAQLRRLQNASLTRTAISWQNNGRYNEHWTSSIDINYVSDDYYLTNLSNGLTQVTPNGLLKQAKLNYTGQYWQFLANIQGYQTLHPLEQNTFTNEYTRFPQLVLDGNYLDERTGLNYSIDNDLSHFIIRKDPGASLKPFGTRLNIQPGISLPVYRPAFYLNPRLQVAMTEYAVGQSTPQIRTNSLQNPRRALPIFDISSGLYFDRDFSLFKTKLIQTLEPQLYYTYIPYHNQNNLPLFDTTLNTLTYDQLFTYNRFSGLDRIGDTNQVSLGLVTRFLNPRSGQQKIYGGIGQILYLHNRRVTLCSNDTSPAACSSLPTNPDDRENRSPLSGVLSYNLTPNWRLASTTIWETHNNRTKNETMTLGYAQDTQQSVNLSYTYALNGDQQPNTSAGSAANNLSQTDLTFAWPVTHHWSTIGRWTENWNTTRLQNFLFGLQYNSCCWTVRFVTGSTFTNVTTAGNSQYNPEYFIEFALKGLGNFGTGDLNPTLNNSFTSYQTNFGQDY